MNKKCIICTAGDQSGDPQVRGYDMRGHHFDVCDECASQKICPRCWGRGEIVVKKRGTSAAIEVCDVCRGSGMTEYRKQKRPGLDEYKMLKVPSWVYDNLRQTKFAIERMKPASALALTSSNVCPRCQNHMEPLKIAKKEFFICSNCQYTQQKIDLSAIGNVALGIIVGLGAAALWHHLSKKEDEEDTS